MFNKLKYIVFIVLVTAGISFGQAVNNGGGGTTPGGACGDSSHALGWTGTAYTCQSITGSALAGGSNTQLQYNNATALGGISQWTTNGTTTITGSGTSILNLGGTTTVPTGGALGVTGSGTIAATTAAALASVPTNCGANTAATGIGANGNAVGCFTPTSLPSGTRGYPLINTNGSTTYATDLLCIDAAKASSGADAGIRAQNAEAAVNGNSSPCVDSRSEIGTTIASSVNPFISTFSGKWYAPAGAVQLANVSAVVGGSVEVEGVTIGTNSANGSLLQALHGSWGAAQGGDFTGGSYASPPTWNSGNTYFWGDCVVNSSVNYCAIGDNLGSGNVPGTDWINWTLMSSMPSPVVQPQLNAVNTSKTSKQNTAFHNITFDCQFVPALGATGLTDQCVTFMNFTGQELWVLDRVMMRNPSVAGVWMEDFVPNFGPSSGQVVYSPPSATACAGNPCDQSAAKVNTSDALNKGLQGAAISTITVAGSNPALATITLSSAPSFPLIRGFADIINVGGTGNVSGMTPFAAGVVDETTNSHGFWQVWSVQSTTVINIIVPNGTAGCASSCGNYYQFPVGINVNSNSKQNERGYDSWTLNASNTPASTANTAFSDYPPLAVQLSSGNIPFNDNHGEGWRVFTCIGCFGASDGQTINNSWPNINTHTGFLLSNSFGTPTNFTGTNLRCNITGGGSTGTMVDHLIDIGNGNTITCANNPVIDYYRTDGNGYAYAQMKNCSEMTKGQCFDGTSASGTYLAGIRINGVNPLTGILVFGGTTSGSAAIGVAAVAGTPSQWVLPTTDPTNGQVLSAGTPSGGKVQLSWATVSGGGLSGLTTNGVLYATGSTTATTNTPPTSPNGVPQILISTPSGGVATAPTFALMGIPVDATNPATLLVTDRDNYIKWSSGTALALPAVATSFASNLPFVLQNIEGATLTITPNAGASDLIDGSATATVLNNFAAFVYQDSTTAPGHWFTIKVPTFAAFGSNCTNGLTWSTTTGIGCAASASVTNVTGTAPIVSSGGATPAISCATCVTSAASLTSTAFMTGAGGQASQTPSATATLSSGGAPTFPGIGTFSAAGAASTPGLTVTGAPFTGGSATTNFPQLYVNDGTGPTTFSTTGTEIGVNTPTGFTGNLLDFHINGASSIALLSYLGTLQLGAANCTTFGTAGGICAAEGTAPTNVASTTALYPDSTAHELEVATNGSTSFGILVRAQPGSINQTSKTAAISTATLCAASAGACNVTGQYHVHWDFWGSGTACSSVTAGSVTFLLTWTDENAVAHSAVALQMAAQTGAATSAMQSSFPFQTALANEGAGGDFTFSTNGSVIQYATGYTACTTGTGTYNLRATVTRLQ